MLLLSDIAVHSIVRATNHVKRFFQIKSKTCANDSEKNSQTQVADYKRLFSSHAQGDLRVVEHVADVAYALGALGTRLAMIEDRFDGGCAGINGGKGVTFTNGVAVTDVHEALKAG